MKQTAEWIRNLGDAWIDLYKEGITDGSADEIWRQAYGKAPPPGVIEQIQAKLHYIQRYIRKEIGPDNLIHSVSFEWYYKPGNRAQSFRELKPQDLLEAIYVLPIGRGKKRFGLRLAEGENDIAWRLMVFHHLKSHGRSWRNGSQRLAQGRINGHVTLRVAKTMFIDLIQMLPPEDLKEFGKLFNGTPNPFNI